MTTEQAITATRALLRDDGSTYRWSNDRLSALLRDGLAALRHALPSAFLHHGVLRDPTLEAGAELPCEPRLHAALPFWAANRALLEDTADAANLQTAQAYMAQWAQLTGIKGT